MSAAVELGPGEGYECHTAVVGDHRIPSAVVLARSETHAALLERIGERRVSHIWWTEYTDRAAHEALVAVYHQGDERPVADLAKVDQMGAWLRQPHSMLVIAWCTATEVLV